MTSIDRSYGTDWSLEQKWKEFFGELESSMSEYTEPHHYLLIQWLVRSTR
jgi:hypothetical protein